jgi:glycosyltransferase involved in cell wall biosynthesis
MRLSIVIPVYNEEKRIGGTLEAYGNYFRGKGVDFEILTVLNNCHDKSIEIIKEAQKKFKEIKYLEFGPGGKGFAIIEGFKDAAERSNDLIGFVDADSSTSPEAFYDLVLNIKNHDGIIASRYIKGGVIIRKQTFQRILASRVFNLMVRILFFMNYRDTQCGAKLFKGKVASQLAQQASETQWAIDIDLLHLAKKNKFRIKEQPTIWEDKDFSNIKLEKASIQMFFAILQLRLKSSRFKRMVDVIRPIREGIHNVIR